VSVTDFLPNQYVTCGVLCNSSSLIYVSCTQFMFANPYQGRIYVWNNR